MGLSPGLSASRGCSSQFSPHAGLVEASWITGIAPESKADLCSSILTRATGQVRQRNLFTPSFPRIGQYCPRQPRVRCANLVLIAEMHQK